MIERAVITSNSGRLRFDLPSGAKAASTRQADAAEQSQFTEEDAILTYADLRRRERRSILAALREAEWKVSGDGGAADLLGIKPTTLASRIKKMGIKRPV